jgi:rhombotail lipoprotein
MKRYLATILALSSIALSGCVSLSQAFCTPNCAQRQVKNSTSLVGFLYPNGKTPPPEDTIPQLRIPLRVGLSFLPSTGSGDSPLDAAHKELLLQRIRQRFASRNFIADIVIIPDYYLANARGFEGLQGVQRLYSVDLMALVSYDQVTHLDDNKLSLGYLTIVGAYILPGTSRDVTTLVDLAVVDPQTRSLVMRAGGTDTRHGLTTPIEQARASRAADVDSFDSATNALIINFDASLTQLQANVRAGTANIRVTQRNGTPVSGGGGAMDGGWLLLLVPLAMVQVVRARRRGAGV